MPFRSERAARDSVPQWQSLDPGARLAVVKLSPNGEEAARYEGEVVANVEPESWLVVSATWTYREMDVDGLVFQPGDRLLEWFSPELPWNAFAVISPRHELRGWYGNVTKPAFMTLDQPGASSPVLYWHDLYLDLIGRPDGMATIRDQDELDASGLAISDPGLFRCILEAADEMERRFRRQSIPFLPASALMPFLYAANENS